MPAVNVLRLFRVFKMVRLFKKLTKLRILINSLLSSVIPVLYSFVILWLVSSLYAIIATEIWHLQDDDNFGTFVRSLFSLYQMCTGDSWASGITRGLLDAQPDALSQGIVGVFVVSYMLIVGTVLMNIVVGGLKLRAYVRARTHTHTDMLMIKIACCRLAHSRLRCYSRSNSLASDHVIDCGQPFCWTSSSPVLPKKRQNHRMMDGAAPSRLSASSYARS